MKMKKTGKVIRLMFVCLIAFAALPGLARDSSTALLRNDPALRAYSRNGLPCSTASNAGAPESQSANSLRQIEQLEQQSVSALKAASEHASREDSWLRAPATRTSVIQTPSRSAPINFTYHPLPLGRVR
jgi:hypothetical protein